jgi:2-polyprenyl-6-methoxyphenol hydroxylase-like FAD-dependent oxidoreductase
MTPLRIGVVGLGFAGTGAASLLRRAGHDVTVYEEVEAPAAIGAGIVLQPTGLAALAEIGVLAATIDRGARLSALHCATPSGRTIVHLDYADLDERLFGIGMHRARSSRFSTTRLDARACSFTSVQRLSRSTTAATKRSSSMRTARVTGRTIS